MPSARAAAVVLTVLLAGCLGGTAPSSTPSDATSETAAAATYTPFPDRATEFPDGPKSPPERPAELTNESLREFLPTYERRWVYNQMYPGPGQNYEAHVSDCRVRSVEKHDAGYVAVVACTAYASYETHPGGENGTPVRVHADWFTQSFTYLVDEDSLIRRDSTDAEEEWADGDSRLGDY